MASSSDDNLDDSRKDDASPHDKTSTRKVSECSNATTKTRGRSVERIPPPRLITATDPILTTMEA